MTGKTSTRHGFTLVEMVVVFALLAVLGGILTAMLKETLAMERFQSEGFDRLLHSSALADQFRADVAQAVDAPTAWQDHTADRHCLILHGKVDHHIVYVWNDATLRRYLFEKGKAREQIVLTADPDTEVELVRSELNPKLLCLRLLALRKGQPLPQQTLEFVADLGGDWR